MGSLNASGIPVVAKQNANVWNIGRSSIVSSGIPQAVHDSKLRKATTPSYARTSAELGTQPSGSIVQRTVVQVGHPQKITESINDTLIVRKGARYIPSASIEEEIALKAISQRSVRHTGNRVTVHNDDGLVERKGN